MHTIRSRTLLPLLLAAAGALQPVQALDLSGFPRDNPGILATLDDKVTAQYDLTKVPGKPVASPSLGYVQCGQVPKGTTCNWICDKCIGHDDLYKCNAARTWAVTYEDGPSEYTPEVLDMLKKNGLKATFFVLGSRVKRFPQHLKRIFDEGHEIGITAWSNFDLISLSNEQIVAELHWTRKIVAEITGFTPRYFRPTYWSLDDRVRAVAKAMGLVPALWTHETSDWKLTDQPNNFARSARGTLAGFMQEFIPIAMSEGMITRQRDFEPRPTRQGIDAIQTLVDSKLDIRFTTFSGCLEAPANGARNNTTGGNGDSSSGTNTTGGNGNGSSGTNNTGGTGDASTPNAPDNAAGPGADETTPTAEAGDTSNSATSVAAGVVTDAMGVTAAVSVFALSLGALLF